MPTRRSLSGAGLGLLSYRYIGRNHSSMNTGPVDNTVTLRRDMRNAAGGLLVAPISISSPEGDVGRTSSRSRTRSSTRCQILDAAVWMCKRIEVIESEVLKVGWPDGLQPLEDR